MSLVFNIRSYNNNSFRSYANTSNGATFYLYKLTGGSSSTSYNITCSDTEHGSISASPTTATQGSEITLTATPANGYKLGSWDVKDANNNAITVNGGKFTMPASNVTVSATFVENGSSSGEETITSGTFTFSDSKLTLTLESGVVIEQSKVSGSTNVNSSYNTVSTLRIYKGHALTFSGKTFTKIEIVVNDTYYGNTLSANSGTITPTSTSGGTIIWEGESDNVVITNNATSTNTQLRTASFKVTYE